MRLEAFSIRDNKSDSFMVPFYAVNQNLAVRYVKQILQDSRNDIAKYPEDFMVHRVGEFETSTGLMVACHADPVFSVLSCVEKTAREQINKIPEKVA